MIIFKDHFTGDELFSDTFPMELVNEVAYKVKGKLRTDTFDVDSNAIGGNASAEGAGDEDGAEAASVSGVDVIMNGRLVEFALSKKEYMVHIKGYMASVKKWLEEERPKELEVFQKNIQTFIKGVLEEFKEYQLYCGESMGPDGMLALMKWDGETPYIYFFKHGLEEEKV